MTKRKDCPPAPGPLEAYVQEFDELFTKLNQRASFREYLMGLLLPSERNKTLTGIANSEPVVGAAQQPAVQRLQWFLSESTWEPDSVNKRRVELMRADPLTAPNEDGVLVIDETGDRKSGTKTAHVGRQYLANLGKIDTGVVSVHALWADEYVYYPLDFEPYTPGHWFPDGKHDQAFRTKPVIALELVTEAVTSGIPFRAVVADSFDGENETFLSGLTQLGVGYVLALRPSHSWWHPIGTVGSVQEVAQAAEWHGPENAGDWQQVTRQFRDGDTETWWALEGKCSAYEPDKSVRLVIATTDPATLPELTTWYLITNLPAPGSSRDQLEAAALSDAAGSAVVWVTDMGGAEL